ncbi:unnamed protein product [Polarella glacialis]|uniref:Uncharacterized protein n=1 Tax=Polarella glacialis TaxID=89957 RepID=A0A813DJM0_POLGL|nr:unnamed protein product [Polarella glacialis]
MCCSSAADGHSQILEPVLNTAVGRPLKQRSVSFGSVEEVLFTIPSSPTTLEEPRNSDEGGWPQDDEEGLSLAAIFDKADAKYSRKCVTAAARNSPTMGPSALLNVFSSGLWRRRCSAEDERGTSVGTNSTRSSPTFSFLEEGVEGVSKESCAEGEICRQVATGSTQRTPQPAPTEELEQETKKAAKEDETVEVDL